MPQTKNANESSSGPARKRFRDIFGPSQEDRSDDSQSEEEIDDIQREIQTSLDKGGFCFPRSMKLKKLKRDKQKTPSNVELYFTLLDIEPKDSVFPHVETLQRLGILDETTAIMHSMGIVEQVIEKKPSGGGVISFYGFWSGHFYVSFKELAEIYGFRCERRFGLVNEIAKSRRVYGAVANGEFIPGKTKAAQLRHPSLRCIQKLMGQLFFARRESGSIIDHEMIFLQQGLAPLLGVFRQDAGLFPTTEENRPSIVNIFVERLMDEKR